ncbi:uncharacterized protein Z519_02281 [Cladophialophora bantiana CBS 173.52]|uniref:Uncharacterized protein n=1 Tax=Cladophialophora bantiana (strain ATCC 10958 / CBS 173.52 / CDC B-1940 / NIH 8579) TaxID=1442370 RepID=A0A0D2I130_CLAB1|nr:uncharacterized protein Z519_02281 [Cladophialophora bantiana CBS 173.52]KIW96890.1 hypothetical protein Z519_02281 [Cladophialophora bantiana CBS 173.52]
MAYLISFGVSSSKFQFQLRKYLGPIKEMEEEESDMEPGSERPALDSIIHPYFAEEYFSPQTLLPLGHGTPISDEMKRVRSRSPESPTPGAELAGALKRRG